MNAHYCQEFEKLCQCPICMNYLKNPVIELKNQHYFCKKCANQLNYCPLCKEKVNFQEFHLMKQLLKVTNSKCPEDSCFWFGSLDALAQHQFEKHLEMEKRQLKNVVEKEIEIIKIEINPHLLEEHSDIYNTYVKDWQFLFMDNREWKWWWWASNPWWEKPCPKCNDLWHKYEDEIEIQERQRQQLMYQIS